MFDFILQGQRINERAMSRTIEIAVGEIENDDAFHFLEIGDEVFPMMARDQGHKKTALYLYPAVSHEEFEKAKEDITKDGLKAIFGKPRSELDVIKLTRDRPPATSVQF